jgi:hypothetical protein
MQGEPDSRDKKCITRMHSMSMARTGVTLESNGNRADQPIIPQTARATTPIQIA